MACFCEDCEHCHAPPGCEEKPYLWLCRKFPKAEGYGSISRKLWDDGQPFKRCRDVKVGQCPLYEERKEA